MSLLLETAGEVLAIDSGLPWLLQPLHQGAPGEIVSVSSSEPPAATIFVRIETSHQPFDVTGWEPLTRGAWRAGGMVVIQNVCASGFDMCLRWMDARPEFVFRWRPHLTTYAARAVLRSSFDLIRRAVLLQYPVLWWASVNDCLPLHACACTARDRTPLLAGPAGVGKSTLIVDEIQNGGQATSDNLCVSDGIAAWGLVEPLRIEGGSGRPTSHGRRERAMANRATALVPDMVVVVRRGAKRDASLVPCEPDVAARSLVTGTYMAGELRRYWAFAATLSAGCGIGPAHADIAGVARQLASRLQCFELWLPCRPGARLADVLAATTRRTSFATTTPNALEVPA